MDSQFKVFKHTDRDHAWFIAESFGGVILVDNCTSLDAAIEARQCLISHLQAAVGRNAETPDTDNA